jgi:YVTN family beta-propeller protein
MGHVVTQLFNHFSAKSGSIPCVVIRTKAETMPTMMATVAATWPAGSDMTGVNFAAGKAFVISPSGFLYVYNMKSLRPAGRIRVGVNIQIETATTDPAEEKLYLANSADHTVVIVDAKTEKLESVANVGLYPWGTHVMDSKDNYCH